MSDQTPRESVTPFAAVEHTAVVRDRRRPQGAGEREDRPVDFTPESTALVARGPAREPDFGPEATARVARRLPREPAGGPDATAPVVRALDTPVEAPSPQARAPRPVPPPAGAPPVAPAGPDQPPEERPPRPPPTRIGPYRILSPLADGGMANVYVAQRDGAEGICVVKRLLSDLETNDVAATRFRREAHVAAYLTHPNVARIIDAGEDDEDKSFYMAMEFIEGKDIESMSHAMLRAHRLLPYPVTLTAVAGILAGLEYAHTAVDPDGQPMSLVHRDLSPRNMMLTFEGEAKVIDFGMAKGNFDSFKTSPNMVLGTLRFVSPEQALAQPVDARSDVYSVAVVLFELLTGSMVVRPAAPFEMMRAAVHEIPPPVTSLNPDLPPALDYVLARGLAKNANDRWPSAGAFREALFEAAGNWCTLPGHQLGEFLREQFPQDVAKTHWFLGLGGASRSSGDKTRTVMADDLRAPDAAPTPVDDLAEAEAEWVRPVTMVTSEVALTTRTGLVFPEAPPTANIVLREPDLADTADDGPWPPRGERAPLLRPSTLPTVTGRAAPIRREHTMSTLPPVETTSASVRSSAPPPPPLHGVGSPPGPRSWMGEVRGFALACGVFAAGLIAWNLSRGPDEVVHVEAPGPRIGATPAPIPAAPVGATPAIPSASAVPAPPPASSPARPRSPLGSEAAARPVESAPVPSTSPPRAKGEAPPPVVAPGLAKAIAAAREVMDSQFEPIRNDPAFARFLLAQDDAVAAVPADRRAEVLRAFTNAEAAALSGSKAGIDSALALLTSFR